jgi:FAD/FMN-containing dehydrogenase
METRKKKHHELYDAISAIVGKKYVVDDEFELIPYAKDISYFHGVKPGIAVRPSSTEEVSAIVKVANRTGYPIVVKGGGNAGGGVTPGEPGRNIMIDMGRLDKIVVDIDNLKVNSGGGARLSTIDDALRPYGYYTYTVIGPYYSATAAGLASGIAGGGFSKNVASIGCNWTQIIGLKVVLPNGDIITTGAGPSQNVNCDEIMFREVTGPDLTGLYISSGGAFGLITEVVQKIVPIPKYMKAICYLAPTIEAAWDISFELSKMGRCPYTNTIMFEMSNYMIKSIAGAVDAYGALLYCVETDNEQEADIRLKEISDICEKHGAVHGNEKLDQFAMHGATGTMEIVHDVGANSCPFMTWESMVPRAHSMEYAEGLMQAFASVPGHRQNATAAGMYLVPMGNIFLVGVTLRSGFSTLEAEEHLRKTWEAGAKYMRSVGTSSAYGQGTNSQYIAESWSPTYAKTMSLIKKALDPNGIMCPGLWNL